MRGCQGRRTAATQNWLKRGISRPAMLRQPELPDGNEDWSSEHNAEITASGNFYQLRIFLKS